MVGLSGLEHVMGAGPDNTARATGIGRRILKAIAVAP
jgi:hypothetical protein